jgi:hypothetical protein
MRDENEVQEMADKAATAADKPSKSFGMTYEEGVRAALGWVLDESIPDEENPLA